MSNELDRINELLEKLELSQHQAARAIFVETEYVISQSTISRVLKGESRDGMTAFVRYALENIHKKLNPTDRNTDSYGVSNAGSPFKTMDEYLKEEHSFIEKAMDRLNLDKSNLREILLSDCDVYLTDDEILRIMNNTAPASLITFLRYSLVHLESERDERDLNMETWLDGCEDEFD